ncbi:MAG: methylamine utilization protein [Phenylobacterium sp.]|nr:methylamine utilization protein [Phenylobacterium sp.]
MRLFATLLAALSLAAPARAGELAVTVLTTAGKAVPNAVVMVRPAGYSSRAPIKFPWAYRMAQKDMQFEPFVLIVPVGAEVAFPNMDPFKHHVFSFSSAKTFELKLYGRDESRTVRFDKAGVIGLGCNIHDDMSAFIRVVDTPFAIKTGARGEAVIRDLPAGAATVTVWHPYLKARGEITRQVTAPAAGTLSLTVVADVRAPPLRRGMY